MESLLWGLSILNEEIPELTENHKSYIEWIRKFFGENAYKNMHKFESVDLTVIDFFTR